MYIEIFTEFHLSVRTSKYIKRGPRQFKALYYVLEIVNAAATRRRFSLIQLELARRAFGG